jgi:hypothetical protein
MRAWDGSGLSYVSHLSRLIAPHIAGGQPAAHNAHAALAGS